MHTSFCCALFLFVRSFPRTPIRLALALLGPSVARPQRTSRARSPHNLRFSHDFQTPFVQQASFSIEREIAQRITVSGSYLYSHGEHLIRARDVNLPAPVQVTYPVFDSTGQNLTGYYTVDSFANWETQKTLDCPYPPCVGTVSRPIPQLGSITVFERQRPLRTMAFPSRRSAGLAMVSTFDWATPGPKPSTMARMRSSLDVLLPSRIPIRQIPSAGRVFTDQRNRFVFSFAAQPRLFHRERAFLQTLSNNWKFAGVTITAVDD